MKKTAPFSKVRVNRVKYLKLFPLLIQDTDQIEEKEEHWPCFEAKIVDDLIMIPDTEQGDKLFRYGSFGKCEFVRTTTHSSPITPLETVPNQRTRYDKPYRLRAVEYHDNPNEPISDFEREFLVEFNQKLFPESLDRVREQNYRECVDVLQRTELFPSSPTIKNPDIVDPSSMETSSPKLLIYERVYLLPEEAIFLQHALGCLTIRDQSDRILSLDYLWNRLRTKDRSFAIKYAVYDHFRSAGWIVKCGLKFGCDYMLYPFGPNFNHAKHCVSIENFWQLNSCTWSFVSGLNRACLNAGKVLLLVRVDLPTELPENNIEQVLGQTKVKIIEMSRWIPAQHQSLEEPKN